MEFIFDEDVDEVGSDVEAYCPKCKADTAHTIITKYEEEIRRVQCSPCGDVHSYRKPRGDVEDDIPEPAAAKKRAAAKKPTWQEARARLTEKAVANARPYSIRDRYREGDLLQHPKFGLGFVTEIAENKVEVTFQDERRILVHNRPDLATQMPAIAPLPQPREDVKKGKRGKKEEAAAAKAKPAATAAAKSTPPVAKSAQPVAKSAQPVAKSAQPAAKSTQPAKPEPAKAAPPKKQAAAAKSTKPKVERAKERVKHAASKKPAAAAKAKPKAKPKSAASQPHPRPAAKARVHKATKAKGLSAKPHAARASAGKKK